MFELFEKYTGKKELTRAEQTREKILMATIKIVGKKGYLNASTRDIVDEAGISMGTLYHHFKNKPEIILGIFDKIFSLMIEMDRVLNEKKYTPDKLLYEKANLMIRNFIMNKGFFRIFSIEINNYILIEDEEYSSRLSSKWNEVIEYVSGLIENGRQQGFFNFTGDSKVIVRIIMGTVLGFLNYNLIYLGSGSIKQEKLDTLFQFIFRGLKYKGDLFDE